MECSNEECGKEFDINFNSLECESNGSSGNHTTSYTYTGILVCPECTTEHDVTINTDESSDTGEIIDIDFQ